MAVTRGSEQTCGYGPGDRDTCVAMDQGVETNAWPSPGDRGTHVAADPGSLPAGKAPHHPRGGQGVDVGSRDRSCGICLSALCSVLTAPGTAATLHALGYR